MPLGQDPLGLVNSTLQTNRQARESGPSNRPFTDALRFRMEQERQTANLQQLEAQQAAMTKNQQRQDLKMAFEMVKAGVPSAAVFDAVNVPNSHHKMLKFVEKQINDTKREGAIGQRASEAKELQAGPPNPDSQRLIAEKLQAIRGLEAGHPIPNDPGGAARAQIEQAGVLREQGTAADLQKRNLDLQFHKKQAVFDNMQPKTEWERLDAERRRNGGTLPPGKMKRWANGLIAQNGVVTFVNADGQQETWNIPVDKLKGVRDARMLDSTRQRIDAMGLIDNLLFSLDDPQTAGTSGGLVAVAANAAGVAGDFARVLTGDESEDVAGQLIGSVQASILTDGAGNRLSGETQEWLDWINSTKGANEAATKALSYYLASAMRGDTGGRFSIRAVNDMAELVDIYSGDRSKVKSRLTKMRSVLQDSVNRSKQMLAGRVEGLTFDVGATAEQPQAGAAPPASPSLKPGDELVPGSGIIIKSIEPSVGG